MRDNDLASGVIPQVGRALRSGYWTFFPSGNVALHPESSVNRVVVFESMEGFEGTLKEPVRLTVEDHWVKKGEGGDEARWLDRLMKRYENGNYSCELAWGTCPKASRRTERLPEEGEHPPVVSSFSLFKMTL